MPEPLLYLRAFAAVASVSAAIVMALRWLPLSASKTKAGVAGVAGIGIGHAAGFYLLQFRIGWPPASALDRYLVILLPAALAVELLASSERVPQRVAHALRMLLVVGMGRVLLHRSVYLSEWTFGQTVVALALGAAITAALWILLSRLAALSPDLSVPLTLAATIQCAGMAIMLAGFLKGGVAASVAAAAILGATVACLRPPARRPLPALVGVGVVSLVSLLMIGTFFGRLPTTSALVLLATPLLCWTTELPWLKQRCSWTRAAVRPVLIAIVLAGVILLAKRKFDVELAPLLGTPAPNAFIDTAKQFVP